ncbi:MAG: hypothetical protein R3178_06745, partial [Rhodothermales bacterium]|nr:hypothetical protein [Rhodothermales bacterium]
MEDGNMPIVGRAVNQFVGRFQDRLGIENSRKLAKAYNSVRYRGPQRRAVQAYRERHDELFLGNDPSFNGAPRNTMTDGWALDRSGNFPFLEETLQEADRMIADRGGQDRRGTPLAQTDYLFHLNEVSDLFEYPRLLGFPTSSEVLATISDYMGMIPVLSQTRPKGVRVFESTNRFNDDPEFNNSQLYHRDIHDMPLVYAIVLVRDVSEDNGPWCFLPASVSARATEALKYQKRGE